MKRFSQRYGFRPVKNVVQVDTIDLDLRNSLWNALDIFYCRTFKHLSVETFTASYYPTPLIRTLWADYFKWPIDTIPSHGSNACIRIREYFFSCEWLEVYDFIEFIAINSTDASRNKGFIEYCNRMLQREMSGYRFIGSQIVPITGEEEIAEIEEALKVTDTLRPAAIHLKTAMSLLSDRKSPDYRNSIKESISSVETICRLIAGSDDVTLGQALKTLNGKIDIHPALQKAFNSLYGYTSDEDGIRHALMDVPDLDFEDAKFMLVSCAAFINYLKLKASKAGINF